MTGYDVSEKLSIARHYVYRAIEKGRLKATRGPEKEWIITECDYLDWAEKYHPDRLHPELLSLRQAADYLGIAYSTLFPYIREGLLTPDYNIPHHRFFRQKTLDGFIQENQQWSDRIGSRQGHSAYKATCERPKDDEHHSSGAIIHWSERFRKDNLTYVPVTCAKCGNQFNKLDLHLVKTLQDNSFTGGCSDCASSLRRLPVLRSSGHIIRRGYIFRHIRTFPEDTWSILKPMTAIRGYVAEHRALIAIREGRPLKSSEQVHHIDGNKTNNTLSNLALRTAEDHRSSHHKLMNQLAILREEITRLQQENLELKRRLGTP